MIGKRSTKTASCSQSIRGEIMRLRNWMVLISLVASQCQGCRYSVDNSRPLTSARRQAVEGSVRSFVSNVARDVTQEGPAAWRKEFADSPSFFMASEGRLVFPNRQAAAQAIDELTRTIKHIELSWADDLRIDPLTEDLALVASSYREIRVDSEGHRVDESGFFTGLAEQRNGQWQFRNAHWSVLVPPSKVP